MDSRTFTVVVTRDMFDSTGSITIVLKTDGTHVVKACTQPSSGRVDKLVKKTSALAASTPSCSAPQGCSALPKKVKQRAVAHVKARKQVERASETVVTSTPVGVAAATAVKTRTERNRARNLRRRLAVKEARRALSAAGARPPVPSVGSLKLPAKAIQVSGSYPVEVRKGLAVGVARLKGFCNSVNPAWRTKEFAVVRDLVDLGAEALGNLLYVDNNQLSSILRGPFRSMRFADNNPQIKSILGELGRHVVAHNAGKNDKKTSAIVTVGDTVQYEHLVKTFILKCFSVLEAPLTDNDYAIIEKRRGEISKNLRQQSKQNARVLRTKVSAMVKTQRKH